MNDNDVKLKLGEALQALTFSERGIGIGLAYGERLAPRAVIADKTSDGQAIATAAVTRDGVIWNPKFVRDNSLAGVVFTVAHETLHEALDHHGLARELGLVDAESKVIPGKGRDVKTLGEAADKVINAVLERDRIGTLIPGALKLDADYTGPLDTRAVYYWLKERQQEDEDQQGEGEGQGGEGEGNDPRQQAPGQGCLPTGRPGEGSGSGDDEGEGEASGPGPMSDADREMMRASIGRHAGAGSALAEAIAPKNKRAGWREVLRAAAQTVSMDSADRAVPSYSRASRRESIDPDIIRPGWLGTEASLCVVLDVSGSMHEHREAIASECMAIARDFPAVRVRLVAHTDRVEFSEWMRPGGDTSAITRATGFTGGTRVAPAYEEARRVKGRWDALVHFTDAEVETPWPAAPARRLFVGVVGAASVTGTLYSEPPAGARVIPVRETK